MVNYEGVVVVADQTQNHDLLWSACGGGGGNLGIVTSFTVKVTKAPEVVTTIQLIWGGTYSNAAQIFDLVQKYVPSADRRLSLQILIGYGGTAINAQWQGTQADAQAALQASGVLSVPGITRNIIQETSWVNATLLWASGTMGISDSSIYNLNMTDGLPQSSRSYFQAGSSYNQQLMSKEGIQTMVNAVSSLGPSGTGWVEHKMLQGAVSDISATGTAFYWRESLYETQWCYYWNHGIQSAAASSWLNSTLSAMQPYVGQGCYINYPDPLLARTSPWEQTYYGGNLANYTAAKTKYDPTNYFSNPLTVKPITSPPSAQASVSIGGGSISRVALAPAQQPSKTATVAPRLARLPRTSALSPQGAQPAESGPYVTG